MRPTSQVVWRSSALDIVLLVFAGILFKTSQIWIGSALILMVALTSLAWIVVWFEADKDTADQRTSDNEDLLLNNLVMISIGGVLGSGFVTLGHGIWTEGTLRFSELETSLLVAWFDRWVMMSGVFVIVLIVIGLRDLARALSVLRSLREE